MQTENVIYRKPSCPYGLKAVELLEKEHVPFEDKVFSSPEEEAQIKEHFHVATTPQIVLEGERIGGYTELAEKFGKDAEVQTDLNQSYTPIIAIFSATWLLAFVTDRGLMGFMGYSLVFLATLKLMDLNSFRRAFLRYDLLSQEQEKYATAYPFLEMFIGLAFLGNLFLFFAAPLALAVGVVGGYSIYKAVYLENKKLNCACVGGNSKVPLGAVSIAENLMMALMGLWVITLALIPQI